MLKYIFHTILDTRLLAASREEAGLGGEWNTGLGLKGYSACLLVYITFK